MKRSQTKVWITLAAILLTVIATFIANQRLTQNLEASYGENQEYYAMGEIVPFGENYQTIGFEDTVDGYSLRVNNAKILTWEDMLTYIGQSEEDAEALLGEGASAQPEKVCLVTITLWNDDSQAPGVDLSCLYCYGISYDLHMDTDLTILANSFLLDAYRDQMADNHVGFVGVSLDPGEKVDICLAYDYSKSNFTERHWDRLDADGLWLDITDFPIRRTIELILC